MIGAYDFFIYIHAGLDGYLRALEADAHSRAQLIVVLEKATGISVERRFEDSITNETPLDLYSEPGSYENKMRQSLRKNQMHGKQNRQPSTPPGTYPVQERPPVKADDMVEATRHALQQELAVATANRNAKQARFNWQDDQAAIESFERTQDKELMDKDRKRDMSDVAFGNKPPKRGE